MLQIENSTLIPKLNLVEQSCPKSAKFWNKRKILIWLRAMMVMPPFLVGIIIS